jgi:CheY-like chemotaxis protein
MAYTILVVADNNEARSHLALSLVTAAPHVRLCLAPDAETARSWLAGEEPYSDRDQYPVPQLLLLDLDLAHDGCFAILEWVRAQPSLRHIPMIVLASSPDGSEADRAYALGANSCVLKCSNEEGVQELARGIGDYASLLSYRPPVGGMTFLQAAVALKP